MSIKLDQIIKNNNGDFYNLFVSKMDSVFSEEDLRIHFSSILTRIIDNNNLKINIERHEYSVLKGRIDSLYGNVILEYKTPRYISKNNDSFPNQKAINQVKTHIDGLGQNQSISSSRILGIVFDGYHIIFIRKRNNIWDIDEPLPTSKESFSLLLKRLLSIGISGKALIIDNLIKDFGTESADITYAIRSLYLALDNNSDKRVSLLYNQWKEYFRQVCGYEFETKKREIKELAKTFDLPEENADLSQIIFSIQTLYSLFIKIFAAETLTYFKHREGSYISQINISDTDQLKIDIDALESGNVFKYEGILNFIEGDFFSWYLSVWNEQTAEVVKTIINKFKLYDFSSLNLEPKEAKDLLKGVYHYLLPKKIRHSLGEYYTPDWLAEHLINSLEIDFSKSIKILDPTCGSGTFINLLIEKFQEEHSNLPHQKQLGIILESIAGIDLNPLAVIAAKTNFIISLSDMLEDINTAFEIPIYLSDSMLVTLEFQEKEQQMLSIPTKVGMFSFPYKVIEKQKFNKLINTLIESVDAENETTSVSKKVRDLIPSLNDSEIEIITNQYEKIIDLEKKNLNGIWLKIIKNFFTPAFLGQFDYIVGNPPWINWQTLPEEYRNSIKKYWSDYKVFLHKGLKARLGSAHDDICVLLTYVIMDNYLKTNGRLGFVLPQNLLQSSGGGDGFRRFKIKDDISVSVDRVDDFIKVNPFSDIGASNKPAVIFITKNNKTKYPVTYYKWNKKNKGSVPSDIRLSTAKDLIEKSKNVSEPIKLDKGNSPWLISKDTKTLKLLKSLVGASNYKARKGIDTSLNGLYWGEIDASKIENNVLFSNVPSLSRKSVKKYKSLIESSLIYPILRGKNIKKWKATPNFFSIVPYTRDGKFIETNKLKEEFPNTFRYFLKTDDQIQEQLINRGIYQKHLININAPIYALYNIGPYTFSPYKVVWKALAGGMISCVISENSSSAFGENKLIIPDHNVLMVPFNNEDEAYYFSGIINSDIFNEFVTSYISWFYSAHILEHIKIPKYDYLNKNHKELSQMSKDAHKVKSSKELSKIESNIDDLALEILTTDL